MKGKKKITTHTRKSLLVSRAYIAFKHGLYLPMYSASGESNIFRVTQFHAEKVAKGKGARERNRHRTIAFEAVQIYNFKHKKTRTKARPFLRPACEEAARDMQAIFNAQMKKLGM